MWRLVVCQPGERLPLVSIVWSSHLNHPVFYNLYIYIYTNFLKQGFFFFSFPLFIYFLIVVILIWKNWRDEILFSYCEVYFGCINMGTHWPSSVWASSCLAFLEREKKKPSQVLHPIMITYYIWGWSSSPLISEDVYIYTHVYIYIYMHQLYSY